MAFAAAQTLAPGVYITANGAVFRADRVRKNREANRFEAISASRTTST
jgi:L-asparaginase